ncbi:septum site-determining protein MinC [Candidatus Blochmannia ocreatus (nom. nud.)]|uniref:Probable septum site-determining protein MinC n=1 Tax=Candidatus Blochmannia ocreatus (nom. nud.) TaxID=251538 RepID=A0ABY4STZ5_9ENTR|nr:septum site-determining protein MinC [Candidatus Blochmannia ocreatus]URJ24938.1 septum site-determining protein MinC [Candidatus Blochmannia ocreatus]
MSISIKTTNFSLLVVHIYSACLKTIKISLIEKIKKAPYFLSENTPVLINVENLNHQSNWHAIYQIISDSGLLIVGVCCCYNEKLKEIIASSGIPIFPKQNNYIIGNNLTKKHKDNSINYKTKLINTPIRSGQKIYARLRDLIIVANVNAGAEIISDGNIHIYGTMRGRVLAGASGNKESQIFCTHLSPELVSIGGKYWLNDQIPQEFSGKSVRLSLKNNKLIIQNL